MTSLMSAEKETSGFIRGESVKDFNPFTDMKVFAFPGRLEEWRVTGSTWPIVLDLSMTNECPHACVDCAGNRFEDADAKLDYQQAMQIIRQFHSEGLKAVSFGGGGEPLANPDTVRVIHSCACEGISVGLITNGHYMDDDWAAQLVRDCKWIRVSIDAAGRDGYQWAHGKSADWDRTLRNVRKLTGIADRNAVVGMGFLTCERMRDEILPAVDLANELGFDYIQFRPYNGDNYYPVELFSEAEKRTSRTRVLMSIPKYQSMNTKRTYKTCAGQHFAAVVDASGNMYRCCEYKSVEPPFGNVIKNTVREVWNSQERRKYADMDVSACPIPCRCHGMNEAIQRIIVAKPTHAEFL